MEKALQAVFVKSSANHKECPEEMKHEYAFIGRSNVGKSSLINMLTANNKLAKTSSTPGKTQLINHYIVDDSWFLVDLPGYGFAKAPKNVRENLQKMINEYLTKRTNLVNVFVLLDCRLAPQKIDVSFMNALMEKGVPFSMVFTKSDKLGVVRIEDNLRIYKEKLLEIWESLPPVFITSSLNGKGRDEIVGYIQQLNSSIEM
ncbi:MAG TPA: ribosome biogenesis GTP-binding protein YihA/YsxC [Bacteroidales bacterium]|nr:ribosome biogenesis GTP-binding protein YihA/YsxC [Bacteroidales bacterium]